MPSRMSRAEKKKRKSNATINDTERDTYKEARRLLKMAIKRSKIKCWKDFCRLVDDDS